MNSVTEQLKASTGLVGEELAELREPLSGKPPTGVGAGDHTAPGVVASTEASAIQDSAHARGPPSPSWSWAAKVRQQRSVRDTIPFLTEGTDLSFVFQSFRHAQHSHPSLRTLAVTGRHRRRFSMIVTCDSALPTKWEM